GMAVDPLQGLLGGSDGGNPVPFEFQVVREQVAHLGLVLDDEHARRCRRSGDSLADHDALDIGALAPPLWRICRGSLTVKILPRPGSLSTSTRPPWAAISSAQMASPNPKPRRFSVAPEPR